MNSIPAAGDDEGLEAVGPQVGEQFQHGLIDHFRIEPARFRMLRAWPTNP